MSFAKAKKLLDLVTFAASQRHRVRRNQNLPDGRHRLRRFNRRVFYKT